jgi:D-alanine-D-alanine ligase
VTSTADAPDPAEVGRVAIVAGGLSHEREVALWSGRRLLRALQAKGVDAELYEADKTLLDRLAADRVDAVVPQTLGQGGEDGALQTALELAGLPFAGSGSRSCRVAWDKAVARTVLERFEVPVPQWEALPVWSFRELGAQYLMERVIRKLGLPLVVKPSQSGSTLGMSGVEDQNGLASALVHSFAYSDIAVIEQYAQGADISVGVLETADGPVALPPVVMRYAPANHFDFAARYTPELLEMEAAELPAAVGERLQALALTAHAALQLRSWSRSDFLVADDGSLVLLEVAITPALTETSPYPFGLQVADRDLADTVLGLVRDAQVAHRAGDEVTA